jgi:GNAT superfamily N-acetyltransferase
MIRLRRTDDLELIHELDRACFPADAPPGEWAEDTLWWLALDGAGPCGYGGLWVHGDTGHWARVGVLPEYQRHGLGSRILRTAIRAAAARGCRRVQSYTSSENVASMRSMAACGLLPYWAGNGCVAFERVLR